jgi:uncharacterized OB-fold protein
MLPDTNDAISGPFWLAAAEGRLDMCWCSSCNIAVWYPAHKCSKCQTDTHWRSLGGRAILLSWTVVRAPLNPMFVTPYIPALVVPDEAPDARLVTQLVDCDPARLRCDMPLEVCFRELQTSDGDCYPAPLFRPIR